MSFYIESDWSEVVGQPVGPTTFAFDVGMDLTITIELTRFYYTDDQVIGFDFVVDGGGLSRVNVVAGLPNEIDYRDLGSVVTGTGFFPRTMVRGIRKL